ncbi:L-type lectin domain-containing protein [Trichostrongylus colubriformis]|uniref:L-type lectin domain-containing protein n=1 Tax=Trichostrongylus colubriformis TaxID=6319 RepID=A0AAN8FWM1_TRICO
MWWVSLVIGVVAADSSSGSLTGAESSVQSIEGSSVHEFRGYYKREHSLIRPYQGAGMEIPFWNIQGNSVVTNELIRLTSDIQSQSGAIWNVQVNTTALPLP